jgi:hypothetical protein
MDILIPTIAIIISVTLAYLLVFQWGLQYYYGFAIVIVMAAVLLLGISMPKISFKNARGFFRNFLIIIALSIDYSCGFVLVNLLKFEIIYLLGLTFIASILAGILIQDIGRSILFACLSIGLSMVMSVLLLSAPLLVGIVIASAIETVLRPVIFVMVASFVGILVGSLASDFFA